MTDAKSPEPSIEEILASIRKIISDDDGEPESSEAQSRDNTPPSDSAHADADDEILELTDVVFTAPPEIGDEVDEGIAPSNVTVLPQPVSPVYERPRYEESTLQPTATQTQPDSDLVSSATAAAASGALARLAHVEAAVDASPIRSGGPSIEDLARELLKPMLRQWIDQNLPTLVERLVERELRKITRKAEDL